MNLLGRAILGVWGLLWAVAWTAIIGTIFLIGAVFIRGQWWTDFIMRWFTQTLLLGVGIRIRVQGREHISSSQACVIMANHRSYLDIAALVLGLKGISVVFVAKRELTRIPFFGWALAVSTNIKVDRGNREQAIAALRESVKKVRGGIGLAIFPEGTRSGTERLLPFKKGVFILAIHSQLPLVPVSIRGSYSVLPRGKKRVRPGVVSVVFGEPIETAKFTLEEREKLMGLVQREIQRGLEG